MNAKDRHGSIIKPGDTVRVLERQPWTSSISTDLVGQIAIVMDVWEWPIGCVLLVRWHGDTLSGGHVLARTVERVAVAIARGVA
jgi:hypothetical protein